MSLDEPLLFYAIIALSAMHASKTTVGSLHATAELYHRNCVRLLISLEEDHQLVRRGVALAATCLLRSYEIMAGEIYDSGTCVASQVYQVNR